VTNHRSFRHNEGRSDRAPLRQDRAHWLHKPAGRQINVLSSRTGCTEFTVEVAASDSDPVRPGVLSVLLLSSMIHWSPETRGIPGLPHAFYVDRGRAN